jgi:hypothetical protein
MFHMLHASTPLQVVEDALCLVFLEHQFAELLEKEGADKARAGAGEGRREREGWAPQQTQQRVAAEGDRALCLG